MPVYVREYINTLVPDRSKRKRWRQYSEAVQHIYASCPDANMDEVAKAVAKRLRL